MGLLDNTTQAEYYGGENFGNYQFTSLNLIIKQFMIAYVGENKIISKLRRSDVQFHAMRAMQELSFDVFKSHKSFEFNLSETLLMPLPQDYINYTKVSYVDNQGIKHPIYPTLSNTSSPTSFHQDDSGNFIFYNRGNLQKSGNLLTNGDFEGTEYATSRFTLNVDPITSAVNTNPINANNIAGFPGTADTGGDGEFSEGFFFNKNKIQGYNLPIDQGFVVGGLSIKEDEKYILKYTVTNYAKGTYQWILSNDNEETQFVTTPSISANGTYTHEIDLSTGTSTNTTINQSSLGFKQIDTTDGIGGLYIEIDDVSLVRVGSEEESQTWSKYKSNKPSENTVNDYQDYENNIYWPNEGERYGLDPQHAQVNGSYYINQTSGMIHFSSNLSGQIIVLDYLSDGLGTDEEMQVHKFAEEAVYKYIAYAVLSTKSNIPEYIVRRYKKEKFAATRQAKLRLSNIKTEEIIQTLRGKSKWIKH